ncbi:MAG TPA: hypothetical protein VGM29_06165 [Polyangiaceae bacterium]
MVWLRSLIVAAVAFSSLIWVKLALFAMVATLIAFVSLPARGKSLGRLRWLLGLAGGAALAGSMLFLVREAVPGMVEGGTMATEQNAVSKLREILFAEDRMRQQAFVDPDGDHVGSAGFLGELSAEVGLRGGAPLEPALLEHFPKTIETQLGRAAEVSGFYITICLPKRGGGFTARPEDGVDDERAEREFVAYAWPAERGHGLDRAYFLDEHERILVADSREQEPRRLIGVDAPPACDDALAPATAGEWRSWRHKQPRHSLPYASSP